MTKTILAPYGSLKFLPIVTKVGEGKPEGDKGKGRDTGGPNIADKR